MENVAYLRKHHGMTHRRMRLRSRGFVTSRELAVALGVSILEIERRVRRGEIETCPVSDRNDLLYRCRARAPEHDTHAAERLSGTEVQYA